MGPIQKKKKKLLQEENNIIVLYLFFTSNPSKTKLFERCLSVYQKNITKTSCQKYPLMLPVKHERRIIH